MLLFWSEVYQERDRRSTPSKRPAQGVHFWIAAAPPLQIAPKMVHKGEGGAILVALSPIPPTH